MEVSKRSIDLSYLVVYVSSLTQLFIFICTYKVTIVCEITMELLYFGMHMIKIFCDYKNTGAVGMGGFMYMHNSIGKGRQIS